MNLRTSGTKFRSNRFAAHFLGTYPELFDGDPRLSGASDKVPEATLQSRDGDLQLSADSDGIYFSEVIRFPDFRDGILRGDVASHVKAAGAFFGEYLDLMAATPLGADCQIERTRPAAAPARVIARHFCKDRWNRGPLDHLSSFEIRTGGEFLLAGRFPVAGSMACSGQIPENSETFGVLGFALVRDEITEVEANDVLNRPVIFVRQEIVTTADALDREGIGAFMSVLPSGLDAMLKLYFPDHDGTAP